MINTYLPAKVIPRFEADMDCSSNAWTTVQNSLRGTSE